VSARLSLIFSSDRSDRMNWIAPMLVSNDHHAAVRGGVLDSFKTVSGEALAEIADDFAGYRHPLLQGCLAAPRLIAIPVDSREYGRHGAYSGSLL
jgi:hypothetical protein